MGWLPLAFRYGAVSLIAVTRHDLSEALRGVRRQPGFALAGVALKAVGLAATTTVISFVYAVEYRDLPYVSDLDRVVRIEERRVPPSPGASHFQDLTTVEIRRLEAVPSFSHVAGVMTGSTVRFASKDGARRISAARVTSGFFRIVEARPEMGRLLTADDEAPGAEAVVLLSYGAWQRYLGGSRDAVGRSLTLLERPHRVVGVLPRGFAFPEAADVVLPLVPTPFFTDRFHVAVAIARLAPDVSPERAALDAQVVLGAARECWLFPASASP
jgi:putative ABC transport system permease protein